MLGLSALFADVPGLGFRVLHRLPPNNSTAWAKVGPSYRPSSCKTTTFWTHKERASNGEVNTLTASRKFPEVEENRLSPKNNIWPCKWLFSNCQNSLLGISSCPLLSWSHPAEFQWCALIGPRSTGINKKISLPSFRGYVPESSLQANSLRCTLQIWALEDLEGVHVCTNLFK